MNDSADYERKPDEVLVVDDTIESLHYLAELLTQDGYRVRTALNGETALWSAASRAPDLVLLDIRMPGLDGFEVCSQLKSNPATSSVPIIFLSAQDDLADKMMGFRLGATDYITKPFEAEEVLLRVKTHVGMARVAKQLQSANQSLEEHIRSRTAALEATAHELRLEVNAHRAAERRLRLVAGAFDASMSAIVITDQHGCVVAANRAFTELTGYETEEIQGQNLRFLNSNKHDREFFSRLWNDIIQSGRWKGEIWNRRKDGNEFPCLHTISAVRDAGKTTHYVGVYHDLSESKDAQTLIEFLTHHDRLTGLPNRNNVRHRFDQMRTDLARSDDVLAVLCLNLDKFRQVNEFHGHPVGDEILRWVSARLLERIPESATLYREGGDEFFLIHRSGEALRGTRRLADELLSELDTTVTVDEHAITISASIGIALYPQDGQTLDELSGNAAIAMARAKTQGALNAPVFYDMVDRNERTRFELAQKLRHALTRNEFEIHYQPQVNADNGKIVAAEALLRWRSPELGMVSPGLFIPVAEQTGLIVDIGTWVLRSVCKKIARWRDDGEDPVKIAVNLSAVQFMRADLPDTVAAAIGESGISPTLIELEITESALIGDVERAIATMHEIRSLGVSLSLDDFGTGYSSLNYLKRFPLDTLKIDQSFVRDLGENEEAAAIVRSIIGLAHNLGMQVVAEGVETQFQREYLAANHCDYLQGYLFSRPIPAGDFANFHRQHDVSSPTATLA